MIEKLMSLNHFTYKKPFSGSDKGNRFKYIIQMKIKEIPVEGETNDDGEPKVDKVKVFSVVCWIGEGNSKVTPDEDKKFREFEFTEKGYDELLEWLNAESDACD